MGAWECARHHFWALRDFKAASCWHCDHGLLQVGAVQKKNGRHTPNLSLGEAELPTTGPGPLKMQWKGQRPSSSQDARAVTDSSPKAHRPFCIYSFNLSADICYAHGVSKTQIQALEMQQWTKHKKPLMEWGETDNIQMNTKLSDGSKFYENKIIKQDMRIKNGRKRCYFRIWSNY